MNETKNGRALQLEGLQFAQNKVTLGFKCEGGTKIQLAQEAQQMGMTLSEYVDTLIASRHQKSALSNTSELTTKIAMLQIKVKDLESKVQFYENEKLQEAFQKFKGQTVPYTNGLGQNTQRVVSQMEDVYLILLDTVKLK